MWCGEVEFLLFLGGGKTKQVEREKKREIVSVKKSTVAFTSGQDCVHCAVCGMEGGL